MAKPEPWSKGQIALVAIIVAVIIGWFGYAALRSDAPPTTPGATPPVASKKAAVKEMTGDPSITVETLPPRGKFRIINDHEHVLDEVELRRLLPVMDRYDIWKVALMGTPQYTFTGSRKYGFEGYKEHNELTLQLVKQWPDRFLAFPTIKPDEPGNVELLQDYVRRGAAGLKLYSGHGASTGKEPFHPIPLDDPRLDPLYQYLQDQQLPISFHINLNKYHEEFGRLMEKFPYLRVCILHFGLYKNAPWKLARLGEIFDRYPNTYTDMSYGAPEFQMEAYKLYDKHPQRYREFMTKYADRIMYATDMVLERGKTDAYIADSLRSYRQAIEMKQYRFFQDPSRLWNGLNLPDDALRKIYEETPARFHLLDAKGQPPDRSRGWPWPGWEAHSSRPGLPPAIPAVQPLPPGTILPLGPPTRPSSTQRLDGPGAPIAVPPSR